MEIGRIGRVPRAEQLRREGGGRDHGTEKVHAPLRALGRAVVHIEQAERDTHIGDPRLLGHVERRRRVQAIDEAFGDVEGVEGGARRAEFGWVVDEGLEGDVVGTDFELEVRLRVVGALVDKGLHHFPVVDGVVGGLARVVEEVGFVVGLETYVDGRVIVAEIDLGEGEGGEIRHGFVVLNTALGRAGGDVKGGFGGSGESGNGGCY